MSGRLVFSREEAFERAKAEVSQQRVARLKAVRCQESEWCKAVGQTVRRRVRHSSERIADESKAQFEAQKRAEVSRLRHLRQSVQRVADSRLQSWSGRCEQMAAAQSADASRTAAQTQRAEARGETALALLRRKAEERKRTAATRAKFRRKAAEMAAALRAEGGAQHSAGGGLSAFDPFAVEWLKAKETAETGLRPVASVPLTDAFDFAKGQSTIERLKREQFTREVQFKAHWRAIDALEQLRRDKCAKRLEQKLERLLGAERKRVEAQSSEQPLEEAFERQFARVRLPTAAPTASRPPTAPPPEGGDATVRVAQSWFRALLAQTNASQTTATFVGDGHVVVSRQWFEHSLAALKAAESQPLADDSLLTDESLIGAHSFARKQREFESAVDAMLAKESDESTLDLSTVSSVPSLKDSFFRKFEGAVGGEQRADDCAPSPLPSDDAMSEFERVTMAVMRSHKEEFVGQKTDGSLKASLPSTFEAADELQRANRAFERLMAQQFADSSHSPAESPNLSFHSQ